MNYEIILRAISGSLRLVVFVFSTMLFANSTINVFAQGSTDGTTPLGLKPGSPAGSYALTDFDVVNLYNGSLNFRLPLYQIAGRGGAGYAITLQVQKKWTVHREFEPGVGYFYYADGSWWSENGSGWIFDAGRVETRTGWREQPTGFPVEGLTRITFTAPDGTEYEFRDQSTNGQPKAPVAGGFNRGTVFVTADGSTATFISDANILDTAYGLEPPAPDGYIKLKDGTQFRVDDGKITWMRDRNGNKVTFGFDAFTRVARRHRFAPAARDDQLSEYHDRLYDDQFQRLRRRQPHHQNRPDEPRECPAQWLHDAHGLADVSGNDVNLEH